MRFANGIIKPHGYIQFNDVMYKKFEIVSSEGTINVQKLIAMLWHDKKSRNHRKTNHRTNRMYSTYEIEVANVIVRRSNIYISK